MRSKASQTLRTGDEQRRRRPFGVPRSLVTLVVVALLAAACGAAADSTTTTLGDTATTGSGDSTPATGDSTPETDDTTPVELAPLSVSVAVAPVPPSMTSMALGVAQAAGIFDEFNLAVDVQNVDSGLTAFRGLEGGQVDISIVPVNVLIPAVSQGTSVKAVYSITERIQHQFVVPSDTVGSCGDLAGKVIAIDQIGGFLEGLTRNFLRSCDLTPEDVVYANLSGGAMVTALVEGQAFGGVLQPERIADMKKNFPDTNFATLANFWEVLPNLHSHVWGVTEANLNDEGKREAVVRFIAAMIRTNEFITDPANEDVIVQATSEYTGGTDPEIVREALPFYLAGGLFPASGSPGMSEEQFGFTIAFAIELGNISASDAPTYEGMVDLGAYDEAVALLDSLG